MLEEHLYHVTRNALIKIVFGRPRRPIAPDKSSSPRCSLGQFLHLNHRHRSIRRPGACGLWSKRDWDGFRTPSSAGTVENSYYQKTLNALPQFSSLFQLVVASISKSAVSFANRLETYCRWAKPKGNRAFSPGGPPWSEEGPERPIPQPQRNGPGRGCSARIQGVSWPAAGREDGAGPGNQGGRVEILAPEPQLASSCGTFSSRVSLRCRL